MRPLALAINKTFALENLLAALFFSVCFYGLLQLAVLVSNNYKVTMWLIALPLAFWIISALQGYCRDLIDKTANLSPEKVLLSSLHFNLLRKNSFIVQIFLFIGVYKLLLVTLGLIIPDYFIAFLLIFFIPASYAYMSITEDALAAINPFKLVQFSLKLGFHYLFIWLSLGFAWLAASQALGHYKQPSFFYTVIAVVTLLFCVNHIGAAIAAMHRTLGIENPEEQKQQKDLHRLQRNFETQIHQFVSAHKYDAAAAFIEDSVQNTEALTDEYVQKYLQESGYTQLTLRHNDHYLKRLANSGYLLKGWTLLLQNLSLSERYYLDDIKLLKHFVDTAIDREQHEASVTLLTRLAKAPETEEKFRPVLQGKAQEIVSIRLAHR